MKTADPPVTENDAIVVECELADPPEKVWRALTIPELVAEWLMPNDIRPEPGARFSLYGEPESIDSEVRSHDADAASRTAAPVTPRSSEPVHKPPQKIECEVLEAQPHRRLQYRWREDPMESVVTFELTGTPTGGTHLRVTHDEFELVTFEPTAMLVSAIQPRLPLMGMRSRSLQGASRIFGILTAAPRRRIGATSVSSVSHGSAHLRIRHGSDRAGVRDRQRARVELHSPLGIAGPTDRSRPQIPAARISLTTPSRMQTAPTAIAQRAITSRLRKAA